MSHRLYIISCACFALIGCASPANPDGMVPLSVSLNKRFNKSVSVSATGGQETNPLWSSQVSSADFATAVEKSINLHRLFSGVIRGGASNYLLDVRLIQLRQPVIGLDMTVEANVEWRLRNASGSVVWQKNISRPYTATVGQAFVGVERLRLANEGAIRENIKSGLEELSRLSL